MLGSSFIFTMTATCFMKPFQPMAEPFLVTYNQKHTHALVKYKNTCVEKDSGKSSSTASTSLLKKNEKVQALKCGQNFAGKK